jgi:starch phosphorylase
VSGDEERARRLSLIDESGERFVRMANLACVGSHAINGVAALHTQLLKQTVLSDFFAVMPERFINVTNGVTPRRWIALSNPALSTLITRHIGDAWISNLETELARLEPLPTTRRSRATGAVKAHNKQALRAFSRSELASRSIRNRSSTSGENGCTRQATALERAVSRDAAQSIAHARHRPAHCYLRRRPLPDIGWRS